MKSLCEKLGYNFKDFKLLETALTHPSFGGDHHVPHYQRLEFLGDAVLELAISRYLFFELPEIDEGKLTRIRAGIVREETLSKAAKRMDLGKYIRLSVGEQRSGGRNKPSILCDVMEAVLAAVYLDGGFDCAVKVIEKAHGRIELKEDVNEVELPLRSYLNRDRKNYVYFKCPTCKQLLRAPKGRGKIRVTCSRCTSKFEKKV